MPLKNKKAVLRIIFLYRAKGRCAGKINLTMPQWKNAGKKVEKAEKESDVGDEAMSLMLKKARREAEYQQKRRRVKNKDDSRRQMMRR